MLRVLLHSSGWSYEYGNLEALFPSYSYEEIKAIRLNNWQKFKQQCDGRKSVGGTVQIQGQRLEMFIPEDENITLIKSVDELTVQGFSKETTNLVFYPLAPIQGVTQKIFDLEYDTALTLRNLKISRQEIKKYETYNCTLKKGGNAKLIELSGSIRPEFWDELQVNKTIYYAWEVGTQGKSNTVSSWDEGAKTITLTNDIDAAVSNDQTGPNVFFGTYFKADISLADYNNYGNFWYVAEGMNFISHAYSYTNEDDTIITLDNVILSGAENNITISSGACKIYATDSTLTKCQLGLSFFSLDVPNNQQLHLDNLTFDDCGYLIAGGITTGTAGNILGSGAYLHPNIAVKKINTGRLNLTNNLAGSFRQFSGSGTKPIAPGATTEFGIITATNNTEYDLITSNSMPVTIDEINADGIVNAGGDLEITIGDLAIFRLSGQAQPSSSKLATTITINDCNIRDEQQFGWSLIQQGRTTVNYIGCTFHSKKQSDLTSLFEAENSNLKQLNIIGGSYVKGVDGGSYYTPFGSTAGLINNTRFIRRTYFGAISIQNFTTELLFGSFFTVQQSELDPTQIANTVEIIDSDILMHLLSVGNASENNHSYLFDGIRSKIVNSCVPGYYYNNEVSQKNASTTKSIVASDNYALPNGTYGALADVLELDYDYDEYTVNAGNVKVVGPIQQRNISNTLRKAIASNALGNEVIIHAQGGDIVFQKFDSSTNPDSNITNDYTCLSGESCKLIPDTKEVFSTSANSSTFTVVAVANGTQKIFSGALGGAPLKVPGTVSLIAGAVSGSVDGDGNITGSGIVKGQVDLFGLSYYIEFTTAPPAATDIRFDYDVYNGHKFTGTITVAAL